MLILVTWVTVRVHSCFTRRFKAYHLEAANKLARHVHFGTGITSLYVISAVYVSENSGLVPAFAYKYRFLSSFKLT